MVKYIDTDVLVYWATDHAEHGDAATRLLRHIELNEKAVTSALSIYLFDAALAPLGIEDYDLGSFLDQVAKLRNLKVEALNPSIYRSAVRLRSELDVPLDVAVGIATARAKKADGVFSNNPAYDKGPLPRRFAP